MIEIDLFEHATNSKKQGDIGEARAHYEYTRLGYVVSKPLCDSARYDLVIEKGGVFSKVQVKTSRHKMDSGAYEVNLSTSGGNKSRTTSKKLSCDEVDILFAMCSNGDCYSLPGSIVDNRRSIAVGNMYTEYRL